MASRINWTDEQWATYLGVKLKEVATIRDTIKNRYEPAIVLNNTTNKYAVGIYRYEITPSGFKRPILICTSNKQYATRAEVAKYANEQFLVNLELNDFWAEMLNVPSKSLQMLHIKER